jgi:hypothetical protein
VTCEPRRVEVGCSSLPPRPVRCVHCELSARGARASERCRSIRRKPCSRKRASCRPVRRSLKRDEGTRRGAPHRTPGAAGYSPGAQCWTNQDFVPGVSRGGRGQPTLLAATSNALSDSNSDRFAQPFFMLVTLVIRHRGHLDQLSLPSSPSPVRNYPLLGQTFRRPMATAAAVQGSAVGRAAAGAGAGAGAADELLNNS